MKRRSFDGRRFGYPRHPSEYDTVCTFNQQSGIAEWTIG
jgi:hypothetical protein